MESWKGSPVFPLEMRVQFTSFRKESPVPDVFERRTSTGSGLFAILSRDFEQIFSLTFLVLVLKDTWQYKYGSVKAY